MQPARSGGEVSRDDVDESVWGIAKLLWGEAQHDEAAIQQSLLPAVFGANHLLQLVLVLDVAVDFNE